MSLVQIAHTIIAINLVLRIKVKNVVMAMENVYLLGK
jgi:hypothetical protein